MLESVTTIITTAVSLLTLLLLTIIYLCLFSSPTTVAIVSTSSIYINSFILLKPYQIRYNYMSLQMEA